MTAPIPEQMRALANQADEELSGVIFAAEQEYGEEPGRPEQALLDQVTAALRAAADELDRLRDRLHHVEHWTVPESIRSWKKEHAEVERLRAVIESAPHDPFGCGLVRAQQRTDYCNCWKADAL